MNVKFVSRRYCPGEAWTNRIIAYAKGLSELGCKVSLIYLIPDKNRTRYKLDIPNVTIMNLWEQDCCFARKFRALSYLTNLLRINKYITKEDKVFVYNAEKGIVWAAKKAGAQVYVEITEHPYLGAIGKKSMKSVDKRSRKLNQVDGISVISNSLRNYYMSIGIPESKISVVNMFVDSSRFRNIRRICTEPYIAYCGVVSYNKDGVNVLLKSFKLFLSKHPEYKLYIAGRGETPSIIDELMQYCIDEGIINNVIFMGQISPNDMPTLLVNAKMLALARPNNLQSQNGFPTKLGEYLATGNPVVVTKVGEIPKFLIHMNNGILAEPDNIEDFAQKLLWVADNYEQAKVIGLKGQELVGSSFSYLTQAQILYNLMNL